MSNWPSIATIVKKVQKKEYKAIDLVNQSLKALEDKAEYKAIIATITERARSRAKEIDQSIARGENAGRLAGVPFIAKDNFLAYGADTTAASNILKGFEAPYQATAIERLETEGAICVAKANLDAFGHGASTENSDFFTTLNPHDKTRVPGGSSGGSAAAVVLDMVPFALGTDTGGSTRQPASFSGCIGFKPTYGLISRSGVIAMASSTDTIGTLARSVEDVALVVDVTAGKDQLDSTTIERDKRGYMNSAGEIRGKKLGIIKEYMSQGVDVSVKAQITTAADKLKRAGADVKEVSLPSLPLSLAVYYIVVPAEISSNLSRYDGQRYGYSDKNAKTLEASYTLSRTRGFGKEAKRRIMIGTYVLSSGYYDAYYKRAQLVRTKLREEFKNVFQDVDLLIGPTAPTAAFKLGENTKDPLKMYLGDTMTVAASLVGIPAISIPVGVASNLPVGLQLMANQRSDRDLLGTAHLIQELIK